VHPVRAALANPRRRILKLLATRNAAPRLEAEGAHADLVSPDELTQTLPAGAVHQGVGAYVEPLAPLDLETACLPLDGRPVLILDQMTDPQNVGALFRSAAAFGARCVIQQDRKSAPLSGSLAKAAVGALDLVAHVEVVNIARTIDALQDYGYLTIGLTGDGPHPLAAAVADPRPVALVIGAEGKGLRALVASTCERLAHIPITPAIDSLNASVAGAIALYEVSRRGS
jgi:23S rRNA (guanosine2251-2'-O)-methyltransferase